MSEKLGLSLNPPQLIGAYLAVNAAPDLYFLVDGPGCVASKAQLVHSRHDFYSTLLSCEGNHRIQYSGVTADTVVNKSESSILEGIRQIDAWPGCGAVMVGSMPMCTIIGTDYDRLVRQAAVRKPVFVLPSRSISEDWLSGYGRVMEAMAAGMDLKDRRPRPDNVAIVGYFMDRNEGDHLGNVTEIRRILKALSLKPVSIWLSGESYDRLREVRNAGAIVSLPHGRKAANILAERLGVSLLETEIPFGLAGSRRWIEQVAAAFGRQTEAEAFIRSEEDHVAPRLEWILPHVFLNKRFAFVGDPYYAGPFVSLVEEVGGEIGGLFLLGESGHLSGGQRESLERRAETVYEPMQKDIEADWRRMERSGIDFLVANTPALEVMAPRIPWIEWGYPSEYAHALADEPFLGFRGALSFLSRVANEIARDRCAAMLRT